LISVLAVLFAVKGWLLRRLKFLAALGREALLVYGTHLAVVYGSPLNGQTNLKERIGQNLQPAELLVVFALLVVSMILVAHLWTWWKATDGRRASRMEWLTATCVALVFVVA
jgi:hypothetical protein